MFNKLFNSNDPVYIGDVEVEVELDEQHSYKNSVTDYTVEEGSNISDHVHKEPERLSIRGIFSDTPIPFRAGSLNAFIQGSGEIRSYKAMEELLLIAGYIVPKQENTVGIEERQLDKSKFVSSDEVDIEPQIIDIVSGLRVYTNMVCTDVSLPKSHSTGRALEFRMGFKRVKFVSSKIVSIDKSDELNGKAPGVKDQAPKTKDAGVQKTKQPKSQLLKVYEFLGAKWRGR